MTEPYIARRVLKDPGHEGLAVTEPAGARTANGAPAGDVA
jgi:hypothetical protein